LLDVSRILHGKLSLNKRPVHLALVIKAAIETVQLAAEAKGIELRFEVQPAEQENIGFSLDLSSPIQVLGDSGRLQQIVWNLLSNAVKFTPPGGRVNVRLEQKTGYCPSLTAHASPYVQITVTDTGKGIASNFLPHVFDCFRQADSTTTRTSGGLGVGLAIVRHLVEAHGGIVQAESPGENQGATFRVKLPLMKTTPTLNTEAPSLTDSPNLNGLHVLLVDDDDETREFLSFFLSREGATVNAVASAQEALTLMAQTEPQLLISDIGMPVVDGYALLRQVRSLTSAKTSQIPAIALTAYAGAVYEQQAIAAGFQRHITKPVDPDRLVSVIANLIRLKATE
jgi:CheY-like chemotaxis protein/two-component sensor histidine kinase